MSLSSMTGFGHGEALNSQFQVVAELSSLNRRQFECHLSLPRELYSIEAELHSLIRGEIRRGVVKGVFQFSAGGQTDFAGLEIDSGRAAAQVEKLRRVAGELGLADDLGASLLLELPGVVVSQLSHKEQELLRELTLTAAREALISLKAMRRCEGEALAEGLRSDHAELGALLAKIRARAVNWPAEFKGRLAQRLEQLDESVKLAPETLAHELVLYADRADVSEELKRLESHLRQMAPLLESDKPVGRELDFICQELLREINTVGSKANDVEISSLVVTFKSRLEVLREQVQNIE